STNPDESLCPDPPVSAGLFGYLAYDLKDRIETLPNTCIDQNLPDLYLCAPSVIFVHDRYTDSVEKIFIEIDKGSRESEKTQSVLESQTFSIDPEGFSSNFSKSEYIEAVEKIIEYIKAGDIYQVNLSQRFSAGFQGDSYTLFLKLFAKNPAPFFSFINAGDHQIISTSPERFIKQNGDFIETRPIKGTIPRGKKNIAEIADKNLNSNQCKSFNNYEGIVFDNIEDKALGQSLLNSLKDDAELSMIVDLMRNDFGKVAVGGTVKVKEHKRLEPYDNVFHLVSIVEARLAPDKSSVDLIRATFPGGSITGCPKIRSMEIIDELESVRRHVYTGSIGYISFHRTLDLSIAIRTAVVAGGKIGFSVGGGIVFDSDPEKEYEETLHKGKTIMETLIASSNNGEELNSSDSLISTSKFKKTPKAWVNGKIIDEKKVVIPLHYTGFQYGAGLFETIRVEKGKILHLQQHLERISSSWKSLFKEEISHIDQITWQNVIDNLIQLNGLEQKTAAVKLMVAQSGTGRYESDFIAVFAREYTHRLKISGKSGLDLITFPERRHTYLAAHKSLNYLYYHLAGKFAKEHGYDESLILNADGTVSETNTASLISVLEIERKVVIPKSDYALPSVTLNAALKIFAQSGYEIIKRDITPFELVLMQNILALNSLMGAVKVLSIDGHKILHTSTSKDYLCNIFKQIRY
ncbi:MAG: chorismate-binding protein, partial [Desulfamplus sp.]|nr:chorismate-binding protein [Desulfamplus sp.]